MAWVRWGIKIVCSSTARVLEVSGTGLPLQWPVEPALFPGSWCRTSHRENTVCSMRDLSFKGSIPNKPGKP